MLTMGRKRQGVNSEIRKTLRGSRPVCGRLPPANFGPIATLPPSLRPKFEGDLNLRHDDRLGPVCNPHGVPEPVNDLH